MEGEIRISELRNIVRVDGHVVPGVASNDWSVGGDKGGGIIRNWVVSDIKSARAMKERELNTNKNQYSHTAHCLQ